MSAAAVSSHYTTPGKPHAETPLGCVVRSVSAVPAFGRVRGVVRPGRAVGNGVRVPAGAGACRAWVVGGAVAAAGGLSASSFRLGVFLVFSARLLLLGAGVPALVLVLVRVALPAASRALSWGRGSWRVCWSSGLGWRLPAGWRRGGCFASRFLSLVAFCPVRWSGRPCLCSSPCPALSRPALPFWRWALLRALWLAWRFVSFPARRVALRVLAVLWGRRGASS